mmetsp:Transcript_572/g.1062  ORF Transcript_572/g.1062 Transcript_572/m.1062 type:complete len:355 (+) Transcript_572:325-1389(+)
MHSSKHMRPQLIQITQLRVKHRIFHTAITQWERHKLTSMRKPKQEAIVAASAIYFQGQKLCKIWKRAMIHCHSAQKRDNTRIMRRMNHQFLSVCIALNERFNFCFKSQIHWNGIKEICTLPFGCIFHGQFIIIIACMRLNRCIFFTHFNEREKRMIGQWNIHSITIEIRQSERWMLVVLVGRINHTSAVLFIFAQCLRIFTHQLVSPRNDECIKHVDGGVVAPQRKLWLLRTHGIRPRRVGIEGDIVGDGRQQGSNVRGIAGADIQQMRQQSDARQHASLIVAGVRLNVACEVVVVVVVVVAVRIEQMMFGIGSEICVADDLCVLLVLLEECGPRLLQLTVGMHQPLIVVLVLL